MAKQLNKVTTTYWIYNDNDLDESLKNTYKEKLVEDMKFFELKMKKMERKDEILRHVFSKREATN